MVFLDDFKVSAEEVFAFEDGFSAVCFEDVEVAEGIDVYSFRGLGVVGVGEGGDEVLPLRVGECEVEEGEEVRVDGGDAQLVVVEGVAEVAGGP
jgi:hypothetical protein